MKLNIKKLFKFGLICVCILLAIFIVTATLYLRGHFIAPILVYHSISAGPLDRSNLLVVSVDTFERQMKFLSKNNFNVIRLRDLAMFIRGKRPLPRRSVVITFDDGFQDNFTLAFPILKKYNIPATIFVCPLLINGKNFMTWSQLKELSKSPLIDIGAHTLDHAFLPDIKDKKQLSDEIKGAKEILERELNKKIDLFCYPAGGFNRQIRQIVSDSGYLAAAATKPGIKYPSNDVFALKRMRVSENKNNLFSFWAKLTGYYLPLKEWQRRYKDKNIGYGY